MGLLRSSHADKSVPIHEKEDAGPVSQTAEQIREICLKGTKQAQEGAPNDAVETFESALPMIAEITTAQLAASNDLKQWSELLLTRFCAVASQMIQNTDSTWLEAETLSAFRAWEAYWAKQSTQHVGGSGFEAEAPRRQVWKQYFATLSFILQNDLQYPSTALATTYKDHSTRQIQSAELVRIEQRYEALLLAEVQFPKAEQHSEEVEEWVSIVTKNWKVLCGGSWEEHDLGAKGRVGVSRHVLDILYRAATKTYHSTQILRQLFTVHLAVAELDLAFKAFETYLEIMKKAKEQVAKTGEQQAGLDSDGDLLRTASECIIALCKYGELEAAEKAKELAVYLEPWLKGCDSLATTSNGHTRNVSIESKGTSIDPRSISPSVCSQGWRAIAIAYAQWARLTYESNLRSDYQLKAIGCLQKALRPEYGHSDDVDALFALATLLAERRQIGVAIKMVGAALSSKQATRAESISGNYARERSLIPLWHLLALLLSAKHEFAEASRACEGAFTQFGDMRTLIGDIDSTYQSEHLKQLHGTPGPKAVIDIMSDFEKEAVLDIKMTQLILAEVQDGPEEAINGTEELLSLYSRLFGEPQGPPETAATQTQPPRTGTSTIRSIKGSIFGRSRRSRRVSNATTAASTKGNGALHEHPENIQTPAAAAPTIQVTGENGNPHDASKFGHHQSNSPRSEKVLHKRSQKSINKRYVSTPIPESGNLASSQGDSASSGRPLSQLVDDLHDEKPDPHLTRFPLASLGPPAICFSVDQSRRHRTGILIRVWLLIAGFYRRAEQWDDAKMAIDAACELVEGLEVDVSRDKTGKVTIHDRGWGVGKSVEEQWADVWSERGHLSLSKHAPHNALTQFEASLTHFPNHPPSIIGLSTILLDIYEQTLLPPPSTPEIKTPNTASPPKVRQNLDGSKTILPNEPYATAHPLGLACLSAPPTIPQLRDLTISKKRDSKPPLITAASALSHSHVPPPTIVEPPAEPQHDDSAPALSDRLAARDRAHGLLDTLTKLGRGWSNAEAWFVLARAYEACGMGDKSRGCLWWCVELEESQGVRGWGRGVGGGYLI